MESKTILKKTGTLLCLCSALGLIIHLTFSNDEEAIKFESSVEDFYDICYPVSVENEDGVQLYYNPVFGIKIEELVADGVILKSFRNDFLYNLVQSGTFRFENSGSLFIYQRNRLSHPIMPPLMFKTGSRVITYCEDIAEFTLKKYVINKDVKSIRLKYKCRYVNKLGEDCLGRTIIHQINFK